MINTVICIYNIYMFAARKIAGFSKYNMYINMFYITIVLNNG